MKRISLLVFLCIVSVLSFAQDEEKADEKFQQIKYTHEGAKYPPVFFVTNVEGDEFKQNFEGFNAFESLDKEAVGLPIGVRVINLVQRKMDGGSFASAMISASTLGLIPVVSNKSFKVRYDVFVQGESIADFEFEMTSTDVENFWATDTNLDVNDQQKAFLNLTINNFLEEVKQSKEIQEVFAEYNIYFGGL